MSNINNDVLTTTRTSINSYQTLAQKAVGTGGSQTGVVAALERFFHKLEFLLKYGSFPTADDVEEDRLPPELQGLKAFLENSSGKTGDSYVLQRNETERYRFSKQNDGKLTVSEEKFLRVPAAVRSGYTNPDTWIVKASTPDMEADEMLSLLESGGKCLTMSCKSFLARYGKTLLPVSSFQKRFSIQHIVENHNGQQVIADFNKNIENISNKPSMYSVNAQLEDMRAHTFTSFFKDLGRASTIPLTLGGVKIPENVLHNIIQRIVPDMGVAQTGNITRFTQEEVNRCLNGLNELSATDKQTICNILQHPQFPLALLTMTNQEFGLNGALSAQISHQQAVVSSFAAYSRSGAKLPVSVTELLIFQNSIKIGKDGELLCEHTRYAPCFINQDEFGISKACNKFSIKNSDAEAEVEVLKKCNKNVIPAILLPLISDIITDITI